MTTRIFATLDTNAAGPGLLVDSGRSIVTTSAGNLDNHRKALGTILRSVGEASYECYFYSDSQTALGSRVAIGVCAPHSPLDKAVGEDNLSYAYYPGTGAIMWNNLGLVSVPQVAERVCLGVHVDLVNLIVRWYAAGNFVGKLTLPAGISWLPAVTISGGVAGDMKASLNLSGPMDYPSAEAA